jgi:transcription elongation GreA/GreB family factor
MYRVNTLPPIAVSYTDYRELIFALGFAREEQSAAFLKQELQRAALYHSDDLPNDVVALNCRVIFRLKNDPTVRAKLLVHPKNRLCPTTEVSALSPVGAALLGLRVGDIMPFVDGRERHELHVDAVGMRFVGNGAPRLKGEEAEGNRCSSRAMRKPPQSEV